jgi:two-component system chemotaxis sensor kinase CheA
LRAVAETAQIDLTQMHLVEGSEVLCLRGETLPLLRLDRLFPPRKGLRLAPTEVSQIAAPEDDEEPETQKVVILAVAEKRFALLVDRLLGQESTVIKPLGAYLHGCSSLAGATISGDGQVRLVLDPAGLLANLQSVPAPLSQKASA